LFKQLPYTTIHGQLGRLNYDPAKPKDNSRTENDHRSFVPCFPLESLLLAINQTRVDYFSLDVEGLELEVLETIPLLEYCAPVSSPHTIGNIDAVEAVQRRFTKSFHGLSLCYIDCLVELSL